LFHLQAYCTNSRLGDAGSLACINHVALNVFLKVKFSYAVRNIVVLVWYLQVDVQNVDVRKEKCSHIKRFALA